MKKIISFEEAKLKKEHPDLIFTPDDNDYLTDAVDQLTAATGYDTIIIIGQKDGFVYPDISDNTPSDAVAVDILQKAIKLYE